VNPVDAARRLLASARVRTVAGLLPDDGRVFLTGGGLRDHLLGLSTRDLDLVVERDARATAESVAGKLGGGFFRLGRPPLATWRVVARRVTLDFWELAGNIETDILRRDFTVNALFWRLPRGPLIDLVGGLEDLAFGRIRTVRVANLHDDPLRVLRAVRLLATHPQLALTARCGEEIAAVAPDLPSVARERIVAELRTLLSALLPGRALATAGRLRLLEGFSPAWADPERTSVAARLADELAGLSRQGRGWLARGARVMAPAVLAFPASTRPEGWDRQAATAVLHSFGFPAREVSILTDAAGAGFEVLELLTADTGEARVFAVRLGERLAECLAWACAVARERGQDVSAPAGRLVRWWRDFRRKPPLLDGDEVAHVLSLPPDRQRGVVIRELQCARARGRVRTRSDAVRWLRDRFSR
jgi:tRNA nucleotidyltransferase (CCA-adding enzyme)